MKTDDFGKKLSGLILNLVAIGLFIPGILLPIFKLDMAMNANVMQTDLSVTLVEKELSIIQTINELVDEQRLLVAVLLFLFSVCIPVVKTLSVVWAFVRRGTHAEQRILGFISTIGKWSMADVFVVAIFLAVLSTNQTETLTQYQMTLFNFQLPIQVSSETLSSLGTGFYYFVGYCILSLLGTQLSLHASTRKVTDDNLES